MPRDNTVGTASSQNRLGSFRYGGLVSFLPPAMVRRNRVDAANTS